MNLDLPALSRALAQLAPVIPPKTANPALLTVKLEAREGLLSLTGMNLGATLTVTVPALGLDLDTFAIAVPFQPLRAFVMNALTGGKKADTISLDAADGPELNAKAKSYTLTLQGLEEAAQRIKAVRPEEGGTIFQGLPEALGRAQRFAAKEEYQAMFKVVAIQPQGETRSAVVATDGFRLSAFEVNGKLPSPIYILREHVGLIEDAPEAELEVTASDTHATFSCKGWALQVDLKEVGTWVDWSRVVPSDTGKHVTASREQVLSVVNRAAILTDGNANHRLDLHASENYLKVTTSNAYGSSSDWVELKAEPVEPLPPLAVNVEYLQDVLKTLRGDTLDFYMEDSVKPIVFTEPDTTLLLVPLRTG